MKNGILFFCVCAVFLVFTACRKNDVEETVSETTLSVTETSAETTTMTTISETTTAATTIAAAVTEAVTETIVETADTQVVVTTTEKAETTVTTTGQVTVPAETTVPEITETTTESTTVTVKEYPPLEPMSEEAQHKLYEDYAVYRSDMWKGATADDVMTMYYFGTYSGHEVAVLCMNGEAMTDACLCVTLDNVRGINLPSISMDILVHTESGFVELTEAYAQGIITADDAEAIYYYADKNYGIVGDYEPSFVEEEIVDIIE